MAAARKRRSLLDSRPARAGSWMALLAATTLGDAADALRAEVKANGLAEGASYRLVVQSYDVLDGRLIPSLRQRPVASVQRAVTAAELRRGVSVPLVQMREANAPVVVAWVEAGEPDLEFDGRTSRPGRGSVYGVVKGSTSAETVQVSLTRKLEAA